jgi:hypothetical protein
MIVVVAQSFTDHSMFVYTGFSTDQDARDWISARIDQVRFTYTIVTARPAF